MCIYSSLDGVPGSPVRAEGSSKWGIESLDKQIKHAREALLKVKCPKCGLVFSADPAKAPRLMTTPPPRPPSSASKSENWDVRSVASSTGSAPEHCGVGMRITDKPPHRVVALVEFAPASNSGQIFPGDELLSVDSKDIHDKPIREVRRLITGVVGTRLRLKLKGADGIEKIVDLVRGGAQAQGLISTRVC